MIYSATVTQKGQVTIPIDIRNFLGVNPYEKVAFIRDTDKIIIKPAKSFLDLKGSIVTSKKVKDADLDKSVLKYIEKQNVKK